MGRMDLQQDEALRSQGWRVFRSSTRDRVIPSNSVGAALQRVRIASALPVSGVSEGVAIPLADREAIARERLQGLKPREAAVSGFVPLSQTFTFSLANQLLNGAAPGDLVEEIQSIGFAPFTGFLSEFEVYDADLGSPAPGIAIRTSSGLSAFRGAQTVPAGFANTDVLPDFIIPVTRVLNGPSVVRRMRVPVAAGDEIFIVFRLPPVAAINTSGVFGTLTLDAAEVALTSRLAAGSAFEAALARGAQVSRAAIDQSGKLEIEREKTRRAEAEARARIEVAKLSAESRRPAAQPAFNPFQGVLVAPQAQPQIQSRQRVALPPPPPFAAPAAEVSGAGQTFVQAWNPSAGSLGYLIPDPPRGGRVNVFDSKYTVWDMFGKKVEEGQVKPVRTEDEIPAEARISKALGVTPSAGIRESQAAILATRRGESAF